MKIINKLDDNKSNEENYQVMINKIIKAIKGGKTEAEIAETPIENLINSYYKSMNLNDFFEYSEMERMFIKEIIREMKSENWNPESLEEYQDYFDIRKKLTLPVLLEEDEQGNLTKKTIEYQILEEAYKTLDVKAIAYIADRINGIFIKKTEDYKELIDHF